MRGAKPPPPIHLHGVVLSLKKHRDTFTFKVSGRTDNYREKWITHLNIMDN
jgi:hypothetical protein